MQKGRVILADWRAERRRELSWRFGHPQIECVECANEADTLQSLESLPCDIVVIGSVGSRPFGEAGLLEEIRPRRPACSTVFLGEDVPERPGNPALEARVAGAILSGADTDNDAASRSAAVRAGEP